MKKALAIVIALIMVLGVWGCSDAEPNETKEAEPTQTAQVEASATPEPTAEPAPSKTTETNYMKIDGLYVDNSYVDEDNDNLKLLYLFYTISTDDKNLQISSNGLTLSIDDTNTYNSDIYKGACKYMSSYYYKSTIEDVYVGSTVKTVSTFKVPKGDLAAGKSISLKSSSIPDAENILIPTDDIVFCDSAEEIAKETDPKGYEEEVKKREDADKETVAKVKKAINGYWWKFYISPTSYKLEFFKPDKFELTTGLGTNSGTYSVRNGYIYCEYSSNGYIVEIPYTFGDKGIELDVTAAFSVYDG